ncbi:hypothetical protein BJ170DRAFT_698406 [Xylariales sp. AK1849]|nr:hypothetical protein BJ170DRAFT_698406 [Xylariales sp. AK1849]
MTSRIDQPSKDAVARRDTVVAILADAYAQFRTQHGVDAILQEARQYAINELIAAGTPPTVNVEYFQWRVDLCMFRGVFHKTRVFPFLKQQPEYYAKPYSVEWVDAYNKHQQIVTSASLYIMPVVQRDAIWKRLYGESAKFRAYESWVLPIPSNRGFHACVVQGLDRTRYLLDHEHLHIVFRDHFDQNGRKAGLEIVLSVLSEQVDTEDVVVHEALRRSWTLLTRWLCDLVKAPADEDRNLAKSIETVLEGRLIRDKTTVDEYHRDVLAIDEAIG